MKITCQNKLSMNFLSWKNHITFLFWNFIFPNEISLSFLIRYLTVSYVFPKLLPDTGKQFFRPYKRSDIEIFFLIIIEDFTLGLLLHTA